MTQHPVFEIDLKVRAYLQRELTLENLGSWFSNAKGSLLALPAHLPVARLAGVIELGRIEMSDGALPEREFRKMLRREVEPNAFVVVEGNPEMTLTASITTSHSGTIEDYPVESSVTVLREVVLQETLTDISA